MLGIAAKLELPDFQGTVRLWKGMGGSTLSLPHVRALELRVLNAWGCIDEHADYNFV